MKYQVITINHEYGSGGRKMRKLLAKKLIDITIVKTQRQKKVVML